VSRARSLLIALPLAAGVVLLAAGCTNPDLTPKVADPAVPPTVTATPTPAPASSESPAAPAAEPAVSDLPCSSLVPLATIQAKFGPDVVPAVVDASSYTIDQSAPIYDATSFDAVARAHGLVCDWNNGLGQASADYQGVLIRVLPDAASTWAGVRDYLVAVDDDNEGAGDPAIAHLGDESSINCGYPDEMPFNFCHDNVLVGSYWIAIDMDGVVSGGARGLPSAPIDQVVTSTIQGFAAH
jgi:hypothetical protein